MTDYPEHDKLRAVKSKSETIGAFIEWLESGEPEPGSDIRIAAYHEHGEQCEHAAGEPIACGMIGRSHTGKWYLPALYTWSPPGCCGTRTERILALYLGIDLDALSAEKDRMLDELRRAAAGALCDYCSCEREQHTDGVCKQCLSMPDDTTAHRQARHMFENEEEP